MSFKFIFRLIYMYLIKVDIAFIFPHWLRGNENEQYFVNGGTECHKIRQRKKKPARCD